MKKLKIISGILVVAVVAAVLCAALVGCSEKEEKGLSLIKSDDIRYLDEIQAKGDLTFEWLKTYSPSKPTLVIIPGESDGTRYSMTLPEEEYTQKSATLASSYVVADGIGYMAEGLKYDLSYYWQKISEWNVVIFHWENFAVEDNTDDTIAKLFSLPKMRYYLGEGAYETTKVPHNNITEIFASLYYEEMKACFDKLSKGVATGKEIRFVGNGVGADLALSAASYLYQASKDGAIDIDYLPTRISLCDPYLSTGDMHMPGDKLSFTDASTTDGMISVVDSLLDDAVAYGATIEMIETCEVKTETVDNDGATEEKKTYSYAYDIERTEKAEESYKNIKSKVAHLTLTESYSARMSDEYKSLKRVALDWYLYSIVGSDDNTGLGSGENAVGYPSSSSSIQSYLSSSSFSWGKNNTRPMLNDRALNNDSTSSASNRGLTFGVSAWTPTVYTRALRGISFTMQKRAVKSSIGTDIHGNYMYSMAEYVMPYFRSESYQLSDQTDYTLICGYVYVDKNGDSFINDGFAGLGNKSLSVKLTTESNSTTTTVAEFVTKTDENGFYVIRLNDKTKDSEGALSKSGYCFSTSHQVELTFLPDSHDYYEISASASGVPYELMGGHNFSGYTVSFKLSSYYADAIVVKNCLVRSNG